MEPLILLFWCLLVVGVPIALFVATFVGIRQKVDFVSVSGGFVIGFSIHVIIVGLTFLPMFIVVYAGAHTEPVGNELNLVERLLFVSLEVIYSLIIFSFCSLLAGRTKPWPLPIRLSDS